MRPKLLSALRRRAAGDAPPAGRSHGSLDTIVDSERRALRPIGTTAYDVARRTGDLLAGLVDRPAVQVFHGLATAGADLPPIPHAVCAGRRLLLIESVAWPPGRYETTTNGRVYCDGTYIGQSVRPLLAAVSHWRTVLPISHRVSAVIVVHPATDGDVALLVATPDDLTWVLAGDAVHDIGRLIAQRDRPVSRRAYAALLAATAGPHPPPRSAGR